MIPRPIDGNTLQTLAKIRIRRVRVRQETTDGVRMDLVEEKLGMVWCIIKLEGSGAGKEGNESMSET